MLGHGCASFRATHRLGSPLPLAGEVDALGSAIARQSAAGGGRSIPSTSAFCGSTPTPTLPRKRERERTSVAYKLNFTSSPSELSQIGFELGQAFQRIGGRVEIALRPPRPDAGGPARIALPSPHRI